MKKAGRGRRFLFFGRFKTKAAARRKERKHPGSFILFTDGYTVLRRRK